MKLNARLHGMDGLHAALGRIASENELRSELATSTEEMRDAARAELDATPQPGNSIDALSRSLTGSVSADGKTLTVSTRLDQGWHLEFGTLRRPPRPWLAPAFDRAGPGILARLRAWLAHSTKRPSG